MARAAPVVGVAVTDPDLANMERARTEAIRRGGNTVRIALMAAGVELPADVAHADQWNPPLQPCETRHRAHVVHNKPQPECRFCAAPIVAALLVR